jgi:hypothetical protein
VPTMFRSTRQDRWRGGRARGGPLRPGGLAGVRAARGGHCPRWVRRSGALEGKTRCQGGSQDQNKKIGTCWRGLVGRWLPEFVAGGHRVCEI